MDVRAPERNFYCTSCGAPLLTVPKGQQVDGAALMAATQRHELTHVPAQRAADASL